MRQLTKGVLSIFLVLTVLITVLPVSASAREYLDIKIIPSATDASVGDVIEYTVTATGDDVLALEFQLVFPSGLRYVENSAAVPEGLSELLGWPEVDWTEETKKWTGYNDVGVAVPTDTVLLTFCAVVEAEGTYEVTFEDLLPYGGSFSQMEPTVNVGSVTAAKPKPTKVTGLKAASIGETAFTVTWDAIEGATKYWVYVDGILLFSTTAPTATVTKCTAGTDYEVKVTARLADDTVLSPANAEPLTVRTTVIGRTAPTATFTASDTCITLEWDPTDCEKTWIYTGSSKDDLTLMYGCTGGTYTINGLKPDTTYYIRLSHSISGKVVMSKDILTVKTQASKNPVKVTGLKATKIEQNAFTVTWDAIEGSTKYWVYVNGTLLFSTTAPTASVTKRTAGTAYEVKVTARLADNTVMALSKADALTVRTQEQEIVIPTATASVTGSDITLTWDAADCAKTWIYMGTSRSGMKLMYACTGGTYTVSNLKPDTTYYIQLSHSIGGKTVMSEAVLEVRTAPANLTVKAQLSGSELTLDWDANADSYKYWVMVVKDGKTLTYSTTNTEYTLTDFDPATCTVSIRGINTRGTYDYDAVVV